MRKKVACENKRSATDTHRTRETILVTIKKAIAKGICRLALHYIFRRTQYVKCTCHVLWKPSISSNNVYILSPNTTAESLCTQQNWKAYNVNTHEFRVLLAWRRTRKSGKFGVAWMATLTECVSGVYYGCWEHMLSFAKSLCSDKLSGENRGEIGR